MSVAERSLSIREARFVAGRGEGFVGVWDRDNPGEPIEHFPDTWSGEISADQRALELLFEFETSQKRLNGVRIFLPRVESRRLPWRAGLAGVRSGSRLRRFLEDHLPSSSHIITPTGPWILTEEEEDPRWSPRIPRGPGGRWYLYHFHEVPHGQAPAHLTILCHGSFPSMTEAKDAANWWNAGGTWAEVPESVPRDLLSTTRWVSDHTP